MEKYFDRWNEIKKATDAADEAARLYFREGEMWWVRLGHNIGYEANGKSREFTRPVIILKKLLPSLCWTAHERRRDLARFDGSRDRASRMFQPCFLAVETKERMSAKSMAPCNDRKPPEIF